MTSPQSSQSPQPAGYSGTPLPKKLGIKAGYYVLFHDAPADFDPQPLPYDVTVETAADGGAGPYDVIVAFAKDGATLTEDYANLPGLLSKSGALWMCWPKKASGVVTDVTENVVREDALALPIGLVDVKIAAIDATWSGLKLVYRLDRR
ncbi:DUF3052 domain-containing protein [Catenulispora rubra]|uniref:DUF3052 domain-containing protein n=1 Tax=Catenulispora rubra TaxID=280293 RepID=UPI00189263E5|nr:DUF3052 domain-containing protein [Catenulispora rubra]